MTRSMTRDGLLSRSTSASYTDRDVSILKVDGATISDTGKKLKLRGQPASTRGQNR